MRRPGGYGHWFNGQGRDLERDTFTCQHCGAVVFVEPFQDPAKAGGWCMCCSKLICRHCANDGECRPFEKQLDEHERAERRRAQ
jgi:hypothetical protein